MFDKIYQDYVEATQRQWHGRRQVSVGASEIGQCARKVWWLKRGAAKDPDYTDNWGAMKRGSVFEDAFWVPALRQRYGTALKFAGADQRTLTSGHLSATPVGLIVDQPRGAFAQIGVPDIGEGRCILVEGKTIDPRSPLTRPKPEHEHQTQVQIGMMREQTAYQPEFAIISYTDASFWNEVQAFAVQYDDNIFQASKARAAKIMTAVAFDELPPEGWIAGGKECAYCPFARTCGRERAAVPAQSIKPIDPQFVAEVSDLARDAKAHEAERDGAETKLREVQNTIRERLRDKGVNAIKTDALSINWSPVKGRESFDMKGIRDAAAAAGVDITRFETVGQPTDRLVIRVHE